MASATRFLERVLNAAHVLVLLLGRQAATSLSGGLSDSPLIDASVPTSADAAVIARVCGSAVARRDPFRTAAPEACFGGTLP